MLGGHNEERSWTKVSLKGLMNMVVELQEPIATENKLGGYDTTYQTLIKELKGRLRPLRAEERYKIPGQEGYTTHRFYVCSDDLNGNEVKPEYRIVHDSLVYRIISVSVPSQTRTKSFQLEIDLARSDAGS